MKKVILIIMMLFLSINIYCQSSSTGELQRAGNTFSVTKSTKSSYEKTIYTYRTNDGVEHPIYITSNNSCFIFKTSKKTGKEYRYYMNEEVTKAICEELHREYKPRSNSNKNN